MERQKQADRILALLQANQGREVSLPAIMSLGIASHTRRIFELREQGYLIEKSERYVGHQRHVSYTLRGRLSNEAKAQS